MQEVNEQTLKTISGVIDRTSTYDIPIQDGTINVGGITKEDYQDFKSNVIFNAEVDAINLENNILSEDNWTLGSGWTGSFARGFTHVTGSNETLECQISSYESATYVLRFTATNQYASTTESCLLVNLGGSPTFEQYQDDGTVTKYFTFQPTSGNLIFTPSANWSGNITDIGLYKIDTGVEIPPSFTIKDTDNNSAFEITATKSNLNNIVVGKNSLKKAVSAYHNTVFGNDALTNTSTGYFNTAIGNRSQRNCIGGTRNISVGYESLSNITYGDRNIAIGTFALQKVTTGRNNVGIGADAAWYTTTGSSNIAISNGALNSNTTGSENIALGYFAGGGNTTGSGNISLGRLANSYNTTGGYNYAIGYFAHYYGINDKFNIAFGFQAMSGHGSTDTQYNVAIGYNALKKNVGTNNIAIGNSNLTNASDNAGFNIAIGSDCMSQSVTCGEQGDNVVIGRSSGRNIAGLQNIAIGRGALNGACGYYNIAIGSSALQKTTAGGNIAIGLQSLAYCSTGEKNVAIGYTAGGNVTTAKNVVCINHAGANTDNGVYIGNAIIYNGTNMGICSAQPTAEARLTLPSGTDTIAPIKLHRGTLKTTPSAGTIEYDGSHLYFTDNSGTRHQLAEVTA